MVTISTLNLKITSEHTIILISGYVKINCLLNENSGVQYTVSITQIQEKEIPRS
jgi:hypothetical protein